MIYYFVGCAYIWMKGIPWQNALITKIVLLPPNIMPSIHFIFLKIELLYTTKRTSSHAFQSFMHYPQTMPSSNHSSWDIPLYIVVGVFVVHFLHIGIVNGFIKKKIVMKIYRHFIFHFKSCAKVGPTYYLVQGCVALRKCSLDYL